MADTPTPGETVTPGDSQTSVQTSAPANTGNAVDPAEVERLRKEAEQARMRANQLEKEAEARKKADEEAEAKRLEEQQEYKTLAEQEAAKRKALEDEIAENQKKQELSDAKTAVTKDYSEETIKEAQELGIDLTDASEASVEAYKAKLDKLQAKTVDRPVTPNNGGNSTTPTKSRQEILQDFVTDNREATFHEVLNTIPALQQMRAVNGDDK